MKCPRCGAGVEVRQYHMTDPVKDLFFCRSCNYLFARYAGTPYETDEERDERLWEERQKRGY